MKTNQHRVKSMGAGMLLVAIAPLVLTACGSGETASDGAPAGKPFVADRATNVPGDLLPEDRVLWTYDFKSGRAGIVAGCQIRGRLEFALPGIEQNRDRVGPIAADCNVEPAVTVEVLDGDAVGARPERGIGAERSPEQRGRAGWDGERQ